MYHFLVTRQTTRKAQHLLRALHNAAQKIGLRVSIGDAYLDCDVLVMYGLGGPDRMPVCMAHMQRGKALIAFDLGYWGRKLPDGNRKFRMAINGFHPRDIMSGPKPSDERWRQSWLSICDFGGCAAGPIMLVGNAPKSIAIGASGWAAEKSREIRKQFPGAKILYRPKPERPQERDVLFDAVSSGDIETELSRCSLVVCRHSNVAVDACRLGVPVVCDDGAAACIYPQRLEDYQNQPGFDRRREFLHRLAYWQWSANESNQFWDWLFSAFPACRY